MNQATAVEMNVQEPGADERPIGCCEYCGADVFDESEQAYHADAECIGGVERFQQ